MQQTTRAQGFLNDSKSSMFHVQRHIIDWNTNTKQNKTFGKNTLFDIPDTAAGEKYINSTQDKKCLTTI